MILEEIKAQTLANHIRLENSPLLSSFGDKTINRPLYQTIIRQFYGFFYPLEKIIDTFTGICKYLPDYHSRRKATWLLQDFQQLEPGAWDKGALPWCTDLPEVTQESQAFGCLYVMEGSTLGGKFISNIVKEKLGLTEATGAAFFRGYGSETGARWKAFGQALTHFSDQTGQQEAIIASANQTFEKLEQWLNSPVQA